MGQTLSHGVYLPAEGERNCYSGLASNWNLLDTALGDIAGKASATHTHGNITNDGKLATADRVVITDSTKSFTTSNVTATELGYLSGVTSAIQTQLNGKAADSDVVHKTGNESISGVKTFLNTNIRFNASSYVSGTPSDNIFYAPILIGGVVNNTDKNTFQHNAAIRTTGINDYSIRVYSQTSNTLTGVVAETNADASNISFRPIANDTHNLGTSSYQWNNLYAKSYFYNGTAWGLDKANVWTGVNTFVGSVDLVKYRNDSLDLTDTTTNNNRYITQQAIDKNDSKFGECYWEYHPLNNRGGCSLWATARDGSRGGIYIGHYGSDSHTDILPANNTYDTNLGTSTNKWKTLNGINPGALSLPSIVAKANADISGAIVGADGETQYLNGTDNYYTAALDGWISMCIRGFTQSNELWITVYDGKNETWGTSGESSTSSINTVFVIFPIRANQKMRIRMKCNDLTYARFYPCQGNV